MSYQTGVLAGTHQLPDGSPITGSVEVIPSVPQVKDSAGHVIISGRAKTPLVNGAYSITLPASSDTTLVPSGVTYTVAVKSINAKSFTIPGVIVPAGQTTHDDQDFDPNPAPVVYPTFPRIALDTDGVPYVQIGA